MLLLQEPSVVEEFFDATMCLAPPPTMPALLRTVNKAEQEYKRAIDDASELQSGLDAGRILHWASVIKVVAKSDPRLLLQLGFPESYKQKVEAICKFVKDDAEGGSSDDPDVLSSEQQRFTTLSVALNDLTGLIPSIDELVSETASLAEGQAEYLDRKYSESVEQPEESADDPNEYRSPDATFDLDRLFSDL